MKNIFLVPAIFFNEYFANIIKPVYKTQVNKNNPLDALLIKNFLITLRVNKKEYSNLLPFLFFFFEFFFFNHTVKYKVSRNDIYLKVSVCKKDFGFYYIFLISNLLNLYTIEQD